MAYSTIPKGSLYMNTKLYTGDGGTQSVTGVGFQPDWTWIKNRGTTDSNNAYDAVRGVTKYLITNTTGAEGTTSGVTAFNSDGFSVGSNSMTNSNSNNYVSWNWKAGGAGSANTDGSVSATVSANTTAGFSIATWTSPSSGTEFTIGHGLGQAPDMMMMKCTTQSNSWFTYHKGLGGGTSKYLVLDTTATEAAQTNMWGANGAETNTMGLKAGTSSYTNEPMVAYFFAGKKGYSKFGSYTGASSNLPFIYTGFKPAYVMIKKRTGAANNWYLFDSVRSPSNVVLKYLLADNNAVEYTGASQDLDLLSNGFKIRNTNNGGNTDQETYIYSAFAENPFVATSGSTGVPVTAR